MANFYLDDAPFISRMARLLGPDIAWAEPRLIRMGALAAGELNDLASEADRFTPRLERYDRHGERLDEVIFHPSYQRMREIAYGEGLVSLAYDDQARPGGGRAPRTLTMGMSYLFAQSEAGLLCPVCMTDGAARVIERFADPEIVSRYLPGLTSQDPDQLLEGAMWLTEKQGGSDVGANSTVARQADGHWRLRGEKWFTSNAGCGVMLVLARPEGAPDGTAGLSLFVVPLTLPGGKRNAIRFERLKDKLGTRSMATAESVLDDAEAWLIASPPRGFKAMAEMINLSRLYNATGSCAAMRRGLHEALSWSRQRKSFGRLLSDHPLMREVLVDMAVECEASTALTFEAISLVDRLDAGDDVNEDAKDLLHTFTPLTKLYTAKQAVAMASEAIECLGGNGYVETFVTPRLLRDAQVLPIWEGTTNVLSLDLLTRAFGKHGGHRLLRRWGESRLADAVNGELSDAAQLTLDALKGIEQVADAALAAAGGPNLSIARRLAFRCARTVQAVLLLSEASDDLGAGDSRPSLVARRHVARRLRPLPASGIADLPILDRDVFETMMGQAPLRTAEAAT